MEVSLPLCHLGIVKVLFNTAGMCWVPRAIGRRSAPREEARGYGSDSWCNWQIRCTRSLFRARYSVVEQEFEQHFKHFVVIAKDVVGAERG